jgi:DNA transposition AAA+ family ATPase
VTLAPALSNAIGLESNLAQTLFFTNGVLAANGVMSVNGIAAFDGVPGTGKTTCARYVAKTAQRPCAIATMPHKPAPLDILRHTYRAITGMDHNGTRHQMQNDLCSVLPEWNGVLIVDELQNAQADAMQELVWLYEATEHAFALVVIGTGVLGAVARYPQLQSRIMGAVTFEPLRGKDLINAVQTLDPRLAATEVSVLAQHDQAICAGLLRRWVMTIRWLNTFGHEGPVDAGTLAQIATLVPKF